MEDNNIKTYIIPDNFIDESRILNGMFATRNFIEGVVLALLSLVPALALPISKIETRVIIVTMLCFPGFALGIVGCNGDPISVTIQHAQAWLRNRGIMLFNRQSVMLSKSPLDAMMERESPSDKFQDFLDTIKENRERKKQQTRFIEGETFEFIEDRELANLYSKNDSEAEEVSDEPEESSAEEPLLTIDPAEPVILIPEESVVLPQGRKLIEVDADSEDDMAIVIPDDSDPKDKKGRRLF